MSIKTRKFADDGWGIWIDGDDRSTIYLNEWINPKGKSYVDIGVRIYGAKEANELNIYVPFEITENEITDLSVELEDRDILRGLFNTNGIVDTEKNEFTSELKYDGRTVSLINLSKEILKAKRIAEGTVITVALNKIQQHITSDEAYVIFRIPHRTLDEVFTPQVNVRGSIERLKELISSPTVTQKYGYSIRINEARLLPTEINKIEVLHQQRIRKALVTISIDEEYELNDSNCYRIRRLEEDLYKNYAPQGYDCSDAITYQWVEERAANMKAHYSRLSQPIISDISFSVKQGQRIALVGSSGCGKSTIANVISGLYKPWSGEILYDGKRIEEIDKAVFCGSLSVVDQEIVLFEDTIENNIKMWDETIEDFEMIMAARDAGIHDDIMERDGGYSYVICENGKDFSGGQRQRLEIARVLAQDPTIVILDEATSALDAKTEKEVMKAITDRGITCIVIAHRLSAIRDCDEIIVLDKGVIAERGTHEELLRAGGRYKELISND